MARTHCTGTRDIINKDIATSSDVETPAIGDITSTCHLNCRRHAKERKPLHGILNQCTDRQYPPPPLLIKSRPTTIARYKASLRMQALRTTPHRGRRSMEYINTSNTKERDVQEQQAPPLMKGSKHIYKMKRKPIGALTQ